MLGKTHFQNQNLVLKMGFFVNLYRIEVGKMKGNNEKKVIGHLARQDLNSVRLKKFCGILTIILSTALIIVVTLYFVQTQRFSIQDAEGRYQATFMDVNSKVVNKMKAMKNVEMGETRTLGTLNQGTYKITIRTMTESLLKLGRYPELKGKLPEMEKEVVVTDSYLEEVQSKAKIGDSIEIDLGDGKESYVIAGILPMQSTADTHSIYVSDKLIERKMPGALYSIYFKINDTQGWNEAGIKSEIDKIAQQLDVPKDSIVYSSYYFSLISQKSIQYISVILGVSLVIAIISSIVIYSIFFVSVLERIGKYGQMRTLGMTKKQIRKIIKIEGNVLTLKGCFWGCVFGGIIAYFIQPKGWYLVNTILISGMASAFVYFVVMLSLYKPAKIASAASPIEALRYFADTEVNINRKHSYKKLHCGD